MRFAGGKMTYLSDLTPSKVEETPFFGHRLSWRRDVNLLGEPLRMKGRTYARGVAVHSRCALTYDLNGRYSTFEALVGFDDAAKGQGRVDCRVFADGKELYSNPDLNASGPPVQLKLPVTGAEQLRLLVDFGRGQDTGDRVDLGECPSLSSLTQDGRAAASRRPTPLSPSNAGKAMRAGIDR